MTSLVATAVIVSVTLVVETAPVCVSVVGVVMSRPQQVYSCVAAESVSVAVDAPVVPVQVNLPDCGPPTTVDVVAQAPVPLATVKGVPLDRNVPSCTEPGVPLVEVPGVMIMLPPLLDDPVPVAFAPVMLRFAPAVFAADVFTVFSRKGPIE